MYRNPFYVPKGKAVVKYEDGSQAGRGSFNLGHTRKPQHGTSPGRMKNLPSMDHP